MLPTLLTAVSAVLVLIGSFLYNDGHDHRLVALAVTGVGWLSVAVFQLTMAAHRPDANETAKTLAHPGHAFFVDYLFKRLLEPMFVEFSILFVAGLVGLGIAKMTRRKPADGRAADPYPFEG
jgi:hypothetical protein